MVHGSHKKSILVVGGKLQIWPEPIPALLARGQVELRLVAGLYDAAVAVISDETNSIYGILLEAESLHPQDIEWLGMFKRRSQLAVWMLPWTARFQQRARDVMGEGAGGWDDAVLALAVLATELQTSLLARGNGETADNHAGLRTAIPRGIPVTVDLTARYDEESTEPLLSEQEIRALLGAPE